MKLAQMFDHLCDGRFWNLLRLKISDEKRPSCGRLECVRVFVLRCMNTERKFAENEVSSTWKYSVTQFPSNVVSSSAPQFKLYILLYYYIRARKEEVPMYYVAHLLISLSCLILILSKLEERNPPKLFI